MVYVDAIRTVYSMCFLKYVKGTEERLVKTVNTKKHQGYISEIEAV
jgi:hypothetical protein